MTMVKLLLVIFSIFIIIRIKKIEQRMNQKQIIYHYFYL